MLTSEVYTLQDNTTIDGQIMTAGELFVKAQYICTMQVQTNWYWNQNPQHHVITVKTCTILHHPKVYVPGHKKQIHIKTSYLFD